MRTLVLYYSRSGVTRSVAEQLRQCFSADLEELIDTKDRKGRLGFLGACKDAVLKKVVPIAPLKADLADYDLVIVGTPVWAGTMCTAVRALLTDRSRAISRAAVFCTTQSSGIDKTLSEMADLCGGDVVARAGFFKKNVRSDSISGQLDAFVGKINSAVNIAE